MSLIRVITLLALAALVGAGAAYALVGLIRPDAPASVAPVMIEPSAARTATGRDTVASPAAGTIRTPAAGTIRTPAAGTIRTPAAGTAPTPAAGTARTPPATGTARTLPAADDADDEDRRRGWQTGPPIAPAGAGGHDRGRGGDDGSTRADDDGGDDGSGEGRGPGRGRGRDD